MHEISGVFDKGMNEATSEMKVIDQNVTNSEIEDWAAGRQDINGEMIEEDVVDRIINLDDNHQEDEDEIPCWHTNLWRL